MAQPFGGDPRHGAISYTPGAEPVSAHVRAAGAINASRFQADCVGYITEAPTLTLDVLAQGDVFITAASDEDATLAVRAPDGAVTCDDDGAGGTHAGVALRGAEPGLYEIWVGTYGSGLGYPDAMVHVAPDRFITDNPHTTAPSPDAAPLQTLSLRAGFRNDPRRLDVTAGGPGRLDMLDWSCPGYASQEPALALDYRAGRHALYVYMSAENDGTLAVRAPDGTMHCNDDRIGLDPGVAFSEPESGRYLIWTGLLSRDAGAEPAELVISEIGYDGVDQRLDVAARPLHGERRLRGGFLPDPVSVDLTAGGPVNIDLATSAGVVADGWCVGNATREPSFRLRFDEPIGPLYISLTSDADTTLAVNSPDGAWYCDDDTIGFDPVVRFDAAEAGVYDIYAGMFGDETAPATLFISEIGGGPDPIANTVDINAEPLFGAATLAAGFLPDPHEMDVEAGGPLRARDAGVTGPDLWCPGHVTREPTANLFWDGDDGDLFIWAHSDVDTTMSINLPDGSWICDDDSAGNLDPGLIIPGALSGRYDIYVGTFSQGSAGAAARLLFSEITPDWAD
ncbi:MAG: hypothetical protein JJU18_12950 [Oceanicaulis sp.]|nr:hypothetical protein [Oceanicaulis sp.]